MSTDYGCSIVYGVLLNEQEQRQVAAAVKEVYQEGDNLKELTYEECVDRLDSSHPELVRRLREKYGAPEQACIEWTGEDHPGRCSTPEDTFLLGVGRWYFPKRTVSQEFANVAEWHEWVWYG